MVHEQEDRPHSQAPSRSAEHPSGPGVMGHERQVGLDAQSSDLPEASPDMGRDRNRSVCHQDHNTTATILQLEARPTGRSYKCLPPTLDRDPLLCQPPLVSNSKGPQGGEDSESNCHTGSSGVEDTTVVPNTVGSPIRPTSSYSPTPVGDNSMSPNPTSCARRPSSVGRMGYIRTSCEAGNLSKQASDLLLTSWRDSSHKNYNSLFHKWEHWCESRDRSPVHGPVSDVNFLAELFHEGYSYSSLNSYRSAISSAHEKIDGYLVGQHPLVTRTLKGAFNKCPPKPHYSSTWKVSQVTQWLQDQKNDAIPLLTLSMKTVTLLALVRPCRSADLANLDCSSLCTRPEGTEIASCGLAKQSRPGKPLKTFFFPSFPPDENICPTQTLKVYCNRTATLHPPPDGKGPTRSFITTVKPDKPATSATIARWIKTVLSRASIDTSIFKAHSVRSASSSAAAEGVSVTEIMEAADWSSRTIFEKYYYKPKKETTYGTAVLKSASNLQN